MRFRAWYNKSKRQASVTIEQARLAPFLMPSHVTPLLIQFPFVWRRGYCSDYPVHVHMYALQHPRTRTPHTNRNHNLYFLINTREMQGIVGQASDFELRGQRSAFCERLSQRWTLVQEIWWRKIENIKGDRRPTLWYGFFCVHISPRTSSTVVRVHVVGVSKVRTLAGMPGLVIALDTAGACQWERGWNVEEKTLLETYSRSQLAQSYSVKGKSNSVFCLQKKKTPFRRWVINELRKKVTRQWVAIIIPLVRWIGFFVGHVNQKTKEHGSMPAGLEAKESPGFFDLVEFFRSPKFVSTVAQCWQSNVKAKLRQVRSVTKTNVKQMQHVDL